MPTMGTGPLEAVFLDIFVICVVPNVLWNDSMVWGDKTGNQRVTEGQPMTKCRGVAKQAEDLFKRSSV